MATRIRAYVKKSYAICERHPDVDHLIETQIFQSLAVVKICTNMCFSLNFPENVNGYQGNKYSLQWASCFFTPGLW